MFLKIICERAFDNVYQDILSRVLINKGLSNHLVACIISYLSSSGYSVLICGSPCQASKSKGVKQGCPLSPLMFITVDEMLDSLIYLTSHSRWLKPIGAPLAWEVFYIQYDDDTDIFWSKVISGSCPGCLLGLRLVVVRLLL